MDKVREKIKTELEQMASFYEEENLKRAVIDKILKNSRIEPPSSMVKKFSDYYRTFNKEMTEEESKKLAEENIKKQFIMDEIAKKEKITVSDEELNQRKRLVAHKETSEEDIKEDLKKEKVLKFLIENAKIKEKEKRVILTPEEAGPSGSGKLSSSRKGSIVTP